MTLSPMEEIMYTIYNLTRTDVLVAQDLHLCDARTIADALATLAGACVDDDGSVGDAALEAVVRALNDYNDA